MSTREDAEAEAALLALGGTLDWKNTTDNPNVAWCWEGTVRGAAPHDRVYRIVPVLTGFCTMGGEVGPYGLPTVNDAKTACEYHHLTGRWEPEPIKDTDAEAALFALGSLLEWYYAGSLLRTIPEMVDDGEDREWYEVRPNPERTEFAAVCSRGRRAKIHNPTTMKSSEAAAKAVCERHHATGDWE